MSEAAGVAMRAVLAEVGAIGVEGMKMGGMDSRAWNDLENLLNSGGGGDSAAEEAARKLIGNHSNVLKDVANPSPTKNIIGSVLTQAQVSAGPRGGSALLIPSPPAHSPLHPSAEMRDNRFCCVC